MRAARTFGSGNVHNKETMIMIGFDAGNTAGERRDAFAAEAFGSALTVPFSFTYGGVNSRELLRNW